MKANDIVINERELLNTKIYNPEFDSIKSIPCTMALRLMDTEEYGCDYCGALNLVLELLRFVMTEGGKLVAVKD